MHVCECGHHGDIHLVLDNQVILLALWTGLSFYAFFSLA